MFSTKKKIQDSKKQNKPQNKNEACLKQIKRNLKRKMWVFVKGTKQQPISNEIRYENIVKPNKKKCNENKQELVGGFTTTTTTKW